MKIACLCCTYLRPELLEQSIESFLQQNYPLVDRELIILDDAGQYQSQSRDGWHLISVPRRFHSLGEKRNACAALASPDVDAFAIWDDDDIYLPWTLESHAKALENGEWSRPSLYLAERNNGTLQRCRTDGMYHASWAFTRRLWKRVGGYTGMNNGEDQEFAHRMRTNNAVQVDPCQLGEVFFVHRWDSSNSWHLSAMGDRGYEVLGERSSDEIIQDIQPHWPRDYRQVTICD